MDDQIHMISGDGTDLGLVSFRDASNLMDDVGATIADDNDFDAVNAFVKFLRQPESRIGQGGDKE